jgi:D-alanyl-D-alanine endopeptidase (penicillin-binding protein 7)
MLFPVSALALMRSLMFCAVVCALANPSAAWADSRPDIKSKSAVVLDTATGGEIFGKDADEIRPIASTTKIFVAMAVRKHLDLDGWTEITKVDAHYARGGARTRLDIGQKFRNKDLLRAMLIASDNRAATALGRAAAMDPDDLVAAMNGVAKNLHLRRTKFTDPTGLHGNASTAREMAIALRAALEDDVLRAIMQQDSAYIVSKDHYARIHYGTTNLPLVAGKYTVTGGKTGYTDAAGYCFITGARFDEHEVVMAFLGADGKLTRFGDFNRIAAWLDHGALAAHDAPAATDAPAARRQRHTLPSHDREHRGRVAAP